MKQTLALVTTIVLASSCRTLVDAEAVRNAEVFFPPRFRHLGDPHYGFTAAERERAVQECKRLGADTLFEFVIDSDGQVKKARIVKTSQLPHRHEDILAHARVMTFSPDTENGACTAASTFRRTTPTGVKSSGWSAEARRDGRVQAREA